MSPINGSRSLPPGVAGRLDAVCDRFESACAAGAAPRLEEFLPLVDEGDRAALFQLLLELELYYRARTGSPVSAQEYHQRVPQYADIIDMLLAAPALVDSRVDTSWTGAQTTVLPASLSPPKNGEAASNIAGYEILGELGRGGMGVVFKACQVKLQRVVALKMIRGGRMAGPEELARFRSEAEAVARLQHPHIVQIFEVGEQEQQPFIALEYCSGGSLAKKLADTPLPPLEAAPLVEKLARSLHVVHGKGIVHRDLKTANVLLTEDGTPKISDFGLAKKLDTAGQTATGDVIGTPSYMAPEQASGHGKRLGPACDIYGLGAILYECLTGRPPFKAASPLDTLLLVMQDDPVPPARLNPRVPRDLETICLKCLHKEPAQRYASAEALAQDLERFRKNEPIRARPTSIWERSGKWARRHPAWVALLGLAAVALLAAPLALLVHNAQLHDAFALADRQRIQAQANEEDARQHAERSRQLLYAADLRLGAQLLKMGNVFDLHNVLDRQRPAPGATEDRRGFEWWYLTGYAQPHRRSLRFPSEGKPRLLAYSPDGKFLIAALFSVPSQKPLVQVWDRSTDQLRQTIEVHALGGGREFALSPDGATVATLAAEPHLLCWDPFTGKEKAHAHFREDYPGRLAFTSDSGHVAVATGKKIIHVWDWASGKEAFALPSEFEMHGLALTRDGKTMLTTCQDQLRWWDLAARKVVAQASLPGAIHSPVFSQDSKWLALGVEGQGVFLGSAASRNLTPLQIDNSAGPWVTAFSPDGRTLAVGASDGTVRLWNVQTRQERSFLRWQMLEIGTLAFSPDGQEMAVATIDGLIHRLHVPARPTCERWSATTQVAGGGALAVTPDGKTLAVAVSHHVVQLLDTTTGQVRSRLDTPEGQVAHLAFTGDGRTLVTLSRNVPFVRFWDTDSGRLKRNLALPMTPLVLALSPSGKLLATNGFGSDPCCWLWDAETGEKRAALSGEGQATTCTVAFSSDSGVLATGGTDGTVRLWDVAALQESAGAAKKSPTAPFAKFRAGAILAIAFAPDGKTLAVSSANDAVHLWRLQARDTPLPMGKLQFRTELGWWHGLQFSADGHHLLTVSAGRCRVWDLRTRLWHHDLDDSSGNWLLHAVLSPDGKGLATTSKDGGIYWWDLNTWTAKPLARGTQGPVHSLAITPDDCTVIVGSAVPIRRGITQELVPSTLPKWLSGSGNMIFHSAPLRNTSNGLSFWNSTDGTTKPGLPGLPTMVPPDRIALSRDGRTLAAGSADGSVWLWDMQRPSEPRRLFVSKVAEDYCRSMDMARRLFSAEPTYAEGVQAVDFAPNGLTLALVGSKGGITVWDVASGKLEFTVAKVPGDVQWVRFSPDGNTLAYNVGGQVRLWDVRSARSAGTFGEVADSRSLCGAFSPDGRLLVSGTTDHGLRTWELAKGRERAPLVGHLGRVSAVAFTPDGKTLASGSWDRTVRLWNVAAWQEVAVLEGHHGNVTCLAFALNGKMLLSGADVVPGELLCWRVLGSARGNAQPRAAWPDDPSE